MKALITNAGTFGPYQFVEVLEDRYQCGDIEFLFSAVGQGEIVEADTVNWPVPLPTVDDIVHAMEALFDSTAQSRRYDNRITCALRAGYPGPFQAEGAAFAAWMDAQNAKAYQMLAEVQAGIRPMPTTVVDAMALLDPMEWPA